MFGKSRVSGVRLRSISRMGRSSRGTLGAGPPGSWGSRPRIPHPRALILLVLCAVAFLVTLSVIMTMRAAADLKRGRSALLEARNDVAKGDLAQAAATFETARNAFDAAKVAMDNPFVSGAASIPFIGRTPDAIRAASQAGLLVTDAGQELSAAVGHLRGGVEALSLSGDRIPVQALVRFQPAVVDALSALSKAELLAAGVATTFVPGEIADAGEQLRSALHRSVSALTSTNAILDALPVFTGIGSPSTVFPGARGSCRAAWRRGSFSYWAILKIDRGRSSSDPSTTSASSPTRTTRSGRALRSRRPTAR